MDTHQLAELAIKQSNLWIEWYRVKEMVTEGDYKMLPECFRIEGELAKIAWQIKNSVIVMAMAS